MGDDGDLIDDAGRDDLELDALVTTLDSVIALPALAAEFFNSLPGIRYTHLLTPVIQ